MRPCACTSAHLRLHLHTLALAHACTGTNTCLRLHQHTLAPDGSIQHVAVYVHRSTCLLRAHACTHSHTHLCDGPEAYTGTMVGGVFGRGSRASGSTAPGWYSSPLSFSLVPAMARTDRGMSRFWPTPRCGASACMAPKRTQRHEYHTACEGQRGTNTHACTLTCTHITYGSHSCTSSP